ncbi:flagellar hook-basal body complex protein [Microbacteriaceae bacterium 4G12]
MNGLYIGSMGMINGIQHINVHSNNIANVQTNGFKADDITSKVIETEKQYRSARERRYIGTVDNSVTQAATHVNLLPGVMNITNNSTDFYLEDTVPGNTSFFVVQQNGQAYLTRNGKFTVNEDGYLHTTAGGFVLDANNNHIQIPKGTNLGVDAGGRLYDVNTNQSIAQLQTRQVNGQNVDLLEKHENGLYTVQGIGLGTLPAGTGNVHNYMLENSNVDMSREMTALMTNQRMVQASQRTMLSFDKIYDKEANDLTK